MTTQSTPQPDWNHWILRLVALVIDVVIWYIIGLLLLPLLFASLVLGGAFWGTYLLLPFISGILTVLYFVIMEVAFGGATIGKKILGLQVQMVDGSKITLVKSLIRNISKIYWLFLFLDWIVGIVTPGADRRQKYSDRIAGTTVVQGKQGFVPVTSTTSPSP
jgi:uncharacterized RDD family membrane protein YckC